MGKNGKAVHLPTLGQSTDPANTTENGEMLRKFALSLIPFTPVPFTGENAWMSYVRLGGYLSLSYATWGRMRKLSYAFMGAAAVSAATSFAANAWNGKTPSPILQTPTEAQPQTQEQQ